MLATSWAKGAERSLYVLSCDGGGQHGCSRRAIGGGFILITSLDGIRYAVRPQSVGIIHDADECRDETMIPVERRARRAGAMFARRGA
jgi:hypothetical protein